MKCRICNNYFYIKRSLLTLFSTNEEYVCNSCYKKYPISLKYEMVDLDIYKCLILSIFKYKHHIDYNLYAREYSKIFIAAAKRKGYFPLFIDHIDLHDEAFEVLDLYSKLLESNILIVTFTFKG